MFDEAQLKYLLLKRNLNHFCVLSTKKGLKQEIITNNQPFYGLSIMLKSSSLTTCCCRQCWRICKWFQIPNTPQ